MNNPYQPPTSSLGGNDSYGASVGTVSPRVLEIMARTRGWVRFAGILFFLIAALSLLGIVITPSSARKDDAYRFGEIIGGFVGCLFYIYPGIKLNSYANGITRLLASARAGDLQAALNEHRGFWKYTGIISIIFLVIVVGAIAVGIGAAVSGFRR